MASYTMLRSSKKQMPSSMMGSTGSPYADAKILLAKTKLGFEKKLCRLRFIFAKIDHNNNGMVPRRSVYHALDAAGIQLPAKFVERMINLATVFNNQNRGRPPKEGSCTEVIWRAVTYRLKQIDFNARDGLNDNELVLISQRLSKNFAYMDTDGDGTVEPEEIITHFKSYDMDGDGTLGPKELGDVMATLQGKPPRKTPQRPASARPAYGRSSRPSPRTANLDMYGSPNWYSSHVAATHSRTVGLGQSYSRPMSAR